MTDGVAAETVVAPGRRRPIGAAWRWIRRGAASWRPIVLSLLLIASTSVAVALFFLDYRPDQQTDKASAREAIKAASEGAVALLSYSPDTLNQDFANAKSRLTDDFQDYYKRFTEQIVAPTAQRGLTTRVRVIRAAVAEFHPKSAVVLVFLNQTTASPDKPQPATTASSVRVTLVKAKNSWLIAKFDSL